MTNIVNHDDLPISHAEACRDPRLAPGGKPICVTHLQRLFRKGKKGRSGRTVKLGTVYAGRGECTTRNLIAEFYCELNEAAQDKPVDNDRPLPGHDEAERQLDDMGIGQPKPTRRKKTAPGAQSRVDYDALANELLDAISAGGMTVAGPNSPLPPREEPRAHEAIRDQLRQVFGDVDATERQK